MAIFKSIEGFIYRHKVFTGAVAIASAFAITTTNYVVGGMAKYGIDHLNPRLHQTTYFLSNWFKRQGADVVILYSADWVTAGNIVSLYNQLNFSGTSLRAERNMAVVAVTYAGQRFQIPPEVASISISTQLGFATFFRSGFYTYVSEQSDIAAVHDEVIQIEMKGPNFEAETTILSIDAFKVERTANQMADYGNQVDGQNYKLDGQEGYQTSITSGAMVLGYEDADFLVGSNADDAILGWNNDDHIRGLGGNDVILGERGQNLLSGGKDGDAFWTYGDLSWTYDGLARTDLPNRILDFSLEEGDVLILPDFKTKYDGSSSNDFIRFEATATELLVLVDLSGSGDDFYPVAVLVANSDFDPLEQSVADLVERGYLQLVY